MSEVTNIAKLSDHAAQIVRQRNAKACVVLTVERDGSLGHGFMIDDGTPQDIQDSLCAAIVANWENAKAIKPPPQAPCA